MTDAQTPQAPAPIRAPADDRGPEGIGGWLILPIIHLVLNAGLILFEIGTGFAQGFQEADASGVSPSIGDFGDVFAAMSGGEKAAVGFFFFGILLVGYAVTCLTMLLLKKRQVPKMMIVFYVQLAVMTIGNYYLLNEVPELQGTMEDKNDAVMGLVRVGIACAIWIPYFLVSKRVKNTFVR